MWIKVCPTCEGIGESGGVTCPTCSGEGLIPSSDPADQYNEPIVDGDGVKHVINSPPDGMSPTPTTDPHTTWQPIP